jgi:hypothetical protein
MPEWLKQTTSAVELTAVEPVTLGLRLLFSLLLGVIVAAIYRRTKHSPDGANSFSATLVLLTILIAMVTQVIGDNIARAFSLVGALSVVRFRTVVQDTRDTAFVIFAVVIGMAVGASNFMVAGSGLITVGFAAWLYRPKNSGATEGRVAGINVRLGLGHNPQTAVGPALDRAADRVDLTSVGTSKRGSSIDYAYRVRLRSGVDPAALIQEINRLDGVQAVRLKNGG